MAGKRTQAYGVSRPRFDLVVEKDVEIPMRDGARLRADVFRPKSNGRFPVIMNIGIYRKDRVWTPPPDLEEKPNRYMNWETVNPLWWTPRGYIAVRVDSRGSGKSPGRTDPWSPGEARDFYDAIEWAGRQAWSNGRVGLAGISYYAMTQWLVANLKPPSLAAMIPWEGAADMYRDFAYHGGIFSMGFAVSWFHTYMANHVLGEPQETAPDSFAKPWIWEYMSNNLDGDWYHGRQARWHDIDVPLFSAGNWSGFGLHLRGNTEGYLRAASRHKKLRIHAGTHFHPFHSEEGRLDQLRWFDHWLKGTDTGMLKERPVKLQIRKGGAGNYEWRLEDEWPLKRTRWSRFYLHAESKGTKSSGAAEGTLQTTAPKTSRSLAYEAGGVTKSGMPLGSLSATVAGPGPRSGVSFETGPLEEDLEVTGPVVLVLWVGSSTRDMDVFATIRNIDAQGKDVMEQGQQGQPVPVAKGYLRASHRKLDPRASLPYRPFHLHKEREWLKRGEVVRLEVEIWPTCMVFAKGHRIRLDVQPRDGIGAAPYTHYSADYNTGTNHIFTGGARASYLLLPVIRR